MNTYNVIKILEKEAHLFANGGKLYEAQQVAGLLHIYGFTPEDVMELREEVG